MVTFLLCVKREAFNFSIRDFVIVLVHAPSLYKMNASQDDGDFLSYMKGPSCIPGLTGSDVIHGSGLREHNNPADKQVRIRTYR